MWAALGLLYLWETIAALLGTEQAVVGGQTVSVPTRNNWMMASPVLALAIIPLFGNFNAASRRGETDTADFARDMLNSVEPYGILVTVGDNDTFPLWYAQEVEGIRRDVLVANTSLLNTDWYVRQMIRRPIEEYDAVKGPKYYRGKVWPKPTHPALNMTLDEADSIPLVQQITEPMKFTAGRITAMIVPERLPNPNLLQRADWLVYVLIKDNPDRPMHFARSSGLYAEELGFSNFILQHGLTRKLSRDTVKASATITRVQGEGWVDVAASKALWEEYTAPASLIKKHKWIDRPSLGIPYLYVTSGLSLADALYNSGDTTGAVNVLERARTISAAVGLGTIFGPAASPGRFYYPGGREGAGRGCRSPNADGAGQRTAAQVREEKN